LGCRRRRMTHAACLSPSRVQAQQAASGHWLHGRPSRAPAPSFRRVTALIRLQPADRLAPGTLCPAFPVNSGARACLSEPHPGAFTWSCRTQRSALTGFNRMGLRIFDPFLPGPLGFGQAERCCGTFAAGMPPD
jgi:hypothetical protein